MFIPKTLFPFYGAPVWLWAASSAFAGKAKKEADPRVGLTWQLRTSVVLMPAYAGINLGD
nr:hypothetical protein [Gammaproteobacteria bacterium]